MNWNETYWIQKEPTKGQNIIMDMMSTWGIMIAFIVSSAPVSLLILLIVYLIK